MSGRALSPARNGDASSSNGAPESEAARLLTAAQVAERWQVPASQVYRLAREGRLASVAIGRYRRYRLEAVEAFELEGGAGVTDG
jgi:excisionase family DNA binding protein